MVIDERFDEARAGGPEPLRRAGETSASPQEARVAALVEAWITGRPHPAHGTIAFSEGPGAVGVDLLVDGDVLIAPGIDSDLEGGRIGYEGRFVEIGDEMTIAGRTLELQDYTAASFVDVVGPMVVRLGDAGGWSALLDDADRALGGGGFPEHLLHPSVLLAERGAFLCRANGRSRASRPVLSADSGPRWAPEGPLVTVRAEDPLVQAFGGVVDPGRIAADIAARPWMGRFIAATELLRRTGRGSGTRIVEFGTSLLGAAPGERTAPLDAPFLSSVDGGWLLEDLASRRRFRVSVEAATVVEALYSSSTLEQAADRCAAALSTTHVEARATTAEVAARLTSVGALPPPARVAA